ATEATKGGESGTSLAVDPAGNAYLAGTTTGTDLPIVDPIPGGAALNGTAADAYVAKLDPSGSTLLYSSYLGGSDAERGSSIAVDGSGNVSLAGVTSSTDFPVTAGAFQ